MTGAAAVWTFTLSSQSTTSGSSDFQDASFSDPSSDFGGDLGGGDDSDWT